MNPHLRLPPISQLSDHPPTNNGFFDPQNPLSRRTSSRPAAQIQRNGPSEQEMDEFEDQRPQFNNWRDEVDRFDPDYNPSGRYARGSHRYSSTSTLPVSLRNIV